jgi:hypothetical protein
MKRSYRVLWVLGFSSVLAYAGIGLAQESSLPRQGPMALQSPIEVQTRGPLHEAIAQPFEDKPGTVIPKGPPPPINEEPPQQKLDSESSQWVPGYWAWDPERQDFTWVSGVYRAPPQGRAFVPGYWSHTTDGWRWVPGYWADARQQEKTYTPEPPAPLNVEPTTAAPDDQSLYIPGSWNYRDRTFAWRPGYWSAAQTGRVWVGPHYNWTPAGYVYVDGYWDYPLQDRGLIFAPATFNQLPGPDAVYRPDYVVTYPGFLDSAYYLPGFGQFYFGNYSDPRYARLGYRPWYAGANRYNPVFAYYGWQNSRSNANWLPGVQRTYAGRASGQLLGPPLTLRQQTAQNRTVVPLNQFKSEQVRVVQATSAQWNAQKALAQQSRQVTLQRSQAVAPAIVRTAPSSPQILTFASPAPAKAASANTGVQIITHYPRANPVPARAAVAPRVHAAPLVHNATVHTNTARFHSSAPAPHATAPVRATGAGHARPVHHKK